MEISIEIVSKRQQWVYELQVTFPDGSQETHEGGIDVEASEEEFLAVAMERFQEEWTTRQMRSGLKPIRVTLAMAGQPDAEGNVYSAEALMEIAERYNMEYDPENGTLSTKLQVPYEILVGVEE